MPIFKRDDIVIKYGADDSRLQKVTKRVKKTGKEVSGFFGNIGKSIGGFFSASLPGLIAGVTTAFVGLSKSALSAADNLSKTSEKVAVSVEDLQKLRYAASAAGVQQNTLDMALQRFSRRIAEAAQGTGVLYKEIERLGIPLRDSSGKMRDTTEILYDYADAIKNAESKQEQLRLAFVAFDSEGAALVNMLRAGSISLKEYMQAAEELGLVIDKNLIESSVALNKQWDDFTNRVSVRFQKAMLATARAIGFISKQYNTLSDVQTRLDELSMDLAKAEEERAHTYDFASVVIDKRIAQIKEEIEQLQKKWQALIKIAKAEAALDKPVSGGGPETEESKEEEKGKEKTTNGKKIGADPEKPEKTYDQQNLEDFQAYRAGEITREEWLDRENNRNPYRNPDSPYAGEMGRGDNYGSVDRKAYERELRRGLPSPQEWVTDLRKVLTEDLKNPIQMFVEPTIVGLEGGESISRAADEEGELR